MGSTGWEKYYLQGMSIPGAALGISHFSQLGMYIFKAISKLFAANQRKGRFHLSPQSCKQIGLQDSPSIDQAHRPVIGAVTPQETLFIFG
jgi:hypothetical protein